MQEKVSRKLFLGFIQLHILHHASKEPFYGAWMIDELKEHGFKMSPGTLYPLLHTMEQQDLLLHEQLVVNGKSRKYYQITELGKEVLSDGKKKATELLKELNE